MKISQQERNYLQNSAINLANRLQISLELASKLEWEAYEFALELTYADFS